MPRHLFVLLATCLLLGSVAGADNHPFTVDDLLAMQRISEAQASPDGRWAVYTLRITDMDANRGRTDLWLIGTDGAGVRRLTTHPASDFNPRWSPDGEWVWFLSTRSGSSQVWRIPVDGGEARQVTDLPLDVANLIVSPDGSRLAFSLDVFPDLRSPAETAARLKEQAAQKATGQIYDRLFVRHWDTWKDGRRSHIFTLPAAGGEPVDIMPGMDADAPSKPFGGSDEFTFTPDSRHIVFTARDAGREEAWSTNFDLYLAPVDGSAPPKNLTTANLAWDTQPVFSPDGRTLAYLAMSRPGFEADRFRILLREWPDGPERELAPDWDRSPGSLLWAADGQTLYVTADHLGRHPVFAIDVATGAARTVTDHGRAGQVSLAGNRLLFGLDHLRSPVELHTILPDGTDLRKVTSANDDHLSRVRFGEPEQFTFPGWNDETVYTWVVRPVDFDPNQKYPVAFLIHGGPQGSFGDNFHYRWNPQVYAGAGYAAVMVDFHGSTGYGQAFTDSISGDWGGKPLEDLQKGLAAALARYPWMDGDRVGALGASYGGYMINWINGAWPGRFRALVCHNGNIDERMAYYDTEELWFPEWERGGPPWENPEAYRKHNPIELVDRWQTPTLVVHGALDYRVVYAQGLSTFTALQRRGIPSQLLFFHDENHWVLKPHNSRQWHHTVIGWLDQWVKPIR